jgi:hypothetical protein
MQKSLRNTSGKPTTVESLDKRDVARNKPSANPMTVMSPSPRDRAAAARAVGEKLDRDREANRLAQAKREAHQGSDNG